MSAVKKLELVFRTSMGRDGYLCMSSHACALIREIMIGNIEKKIVT